MGSLEPPYFSGSHLHCLKHTLKALKITPPMLQSLKIFPGKYAPDPLDSRACGVPKLIEPPGNDKILGHAPAMFKLVKIHALASYLVLV